MDMSQITMKQAFTIVNWFSYSVMVYLMTLLLAGKCYKPSAETRKLG